VRLARQLSSHDDAHLVGSPGAMIHSRLAFPPRNLPGQSLGEPGAHRVQAELILGQQLRRARADELSVGDIVADQLLHRPGVQCLVMRLEGDQIVFGQVIQPVGQPDIDPPTSTANDHHVEELLLFGQVELDLNREGQAGEEVGQEQPEKPVPVAQGIAVGGSNHPLMYVQLPALLLDTGSPDRINHVTGCWSLRLPEWYESSRLCRPGF
jgi:hypothetical protein